jgi:hypothetical protein
MSKKKKDDSKKKAKVHKDLEGFEIKINPLGEITSNYDIDQLNEFLNKNVQDKKLVNRDDLDLGADDDDDFHVEDNGEEEESEEEFISKTKKAPEKDDDGDLDDDPAKTDDFDDPDFNPPKPRKK